jgi:hypothetical protein
MRVRNDWSAFSARVAGHRADVRVRSEGGHDALDRVGSHHAIGVGEHEERSTRPGRPAHERALLADRLGVIEHLQPRLGRRHPLHQLRGAVVGAVVDCDHLQVRVAGAQQRLETALDHIALVLDSHEARHQRLPMNERWVLARVAVAHEGQVDDPAQRGQHEDAVEAEQRIDGQVVQPRREQHRQRSKGQQYHGAAQRPPALRARRAQEARPGRA